MRLVLGIVVALLCRGALAEDVLAPCLDCHQPGNRMGEVPLIEGQHAAYLALQLRRFRERHRDTFPMDALARGFDDADIDRISRELGTRAWRAWPPTTVDEVESARGAVVAERYDCAVCHDASFHGGDVIPRLAGQRPGYLARQIAGFNAAGRYHPPTGSGARIDGLDEEQRAAIALWLSRLP